MQNHQEIEMSHDQISELIEGQKQLQRQFNAFAETQDQLVYQISGNPLDREDRGMIGKLTKVEEDVAILKEERKKWKYTVKGAVLLGSGVLVVVQIILKAFFH